MKCTKINMKQKNNMMKIIIRGKDKGKIKKRKKDREEIQDPGLMTDIMINFLIDKMKEKETNNVTDLDQDKRKNKEKEEDLMKDK